MDEQALEKLQDLVKAAFPGRAIMIILPEPSPAEPRPAEPFLRDMTIQDYIERFAPGMSESRVADWCRAGMFPTTEDENGKRIPGAYLDDRRWYITLAGIQARQEAARARASGRKRRGDSDRRDRRH